MIKLDQTDVQILELLKKDARLSIRELGRKVHLSAPSVTDRVRKLEDEGIISGYTIQINRKALGFTMDCWIEITLRNADIQGFNAFISNCPNVVHCYCVAGRACYMMLLTAPALSDIEKLINEMAPFANTVTSIIFSEVPSSDTLIRHSPRIEN
jgi:Lrp/AsnC family leucine-responsive transcriptional regulator